MSSPKDKKTFIMGFPEKEAAPTEKEAAPNSEKAVKTKKIDLVGKQPAAKRAVSQKRGLPSYETKLAGREAVPWMLPVYAGEILFDSQLKLLRSQLKLMRGLQDIYFNSL